MKKRNLLLFIIVLLLFFVSCSTTIPVTYTEPSTINMGSYRNIALSSPVKGKVQNSIPFYIRYDLSDPTIRTYVFLSSYSASSVEDEAATSLGNAMKKIFEDNSYYNTLPPSSTDIILKSGSLFGRDSSKELRTNGYDAVVIPRIERLNTDEYIGARKRVDSSTGKEESIYTLYRSVSVTISVNVVDTLTNQIVVTKSYSKSDSSEYVFNPEDVVFFSYVGEGFDDLVSSCINDMLSEIRKDFIPQSKTTDATLMSNKPKSERAENGYEYAKNGDLVNALKVFSETYRNEGHIPSGYNASILLASTGKFEEAIVLLEDISSRTTNKDVFKLMNGIKEIKKRDDEAKEQMRSSGKPTNVTNGVYDMLLNNN